MTLEILSQIILLGVVLSMDAFAVSITDGLIYSNINKRKMILIAITFGVMQALMPLIGYWVIELISFIVGETGGEKAGNILSIIVVWLSFSILVILGIKMIIEASRELKKAPEEKKLKQFSYKEVFIMGIATAIDALATGVSLHSGTLSNNNTIWLHVCIIMCITFIISFLGCLFGHFFEKLFKGKFEITSIIGGSILILLGVWIILSHYFNL